MAVAEKVALDHPEVLDGGRADGELHGGPDCLKLQKLKKRDFF